MGLRINIARREGGQGRKKYRTEKNNCTLAPQERVKRRLGAREEGKAATLVDVKEILKES